MSYLVHRGKTFYGELPEDTVTPGQTGIYCLPCDRGRDPDYRTLRPARTEPSEPHGNSVFKNLKEPWVSGGLRIYGGFTWTDL